MSLASTNFEERAGGWNQITQVVISIAFPAGRGPVDTDSTGVTGVAYADLSEGAGRWIFWDLIVGISKALEGAIIADGAGV